MAPAPLSHRSSCDRLYVLHHVNVFCIIQAIALDAQISDGMRQYAYEVI